MSSERVVDTAGSSGSGSSWRRANLSYREKFVDDFEVKVLTKHKDQPPLRITQASSALEAKRQLERFDETRSKFRRITGGWLSSNTPGGWGGAG